MISTFRLLILIIVLNVLITLLGTIYWDPTLVDYSIIDQSQSNLNVYENDINSDEFGTGSVKTTDLKISDTSYGNLFAWTKMLFSFVSKAFIPWSINASQFNGHIEKMIAWSIIFFRSLLYIIFAWDIVINVIKNKKTS